MGLRSQKSLVRIPSHLSCEEASTLPCAALTAYNALMGPVPLKGGDYVLVQGTGGVSIFGFQLAVASGATVIATSSLDDKLKVAAKLGAKHLINYKKTPDWEKEVLKIVRAIGCFMPPVLFLIADLRRTAKAWTILSRWAFRYAGKVCQGRALCWVDSHHRVCCWCRWRHELIACASDWKGCCTSRHHDRFACTIRKHEPADY
ncbi:hypothetical protein AcV5_005332 [Taiwanofungus camphoratus]|nr:hypothetical protein AcV5_005332 [Antrodia cinnamomea]